MLPPTIAVLDGAGRVTCPPPAHVPAAAVDVDIPWTMWLPAAVPDCLRSNVKSMVRAAVWQAARHYHASLMQLPIAFVKKGTVLSCKATQAIPKGKLVVPVFFRRDASLVYVDATNYASVTKHAVLTKIAWAPSKQETEASGGSEEDTHTVAVMPEFKLPKPAVAGETTTAWDLHDNVHPFWAIPRQKSEDQTPNCFLHEKAMTFAIAGQPPEGASGVPNSSFSYRVELPYIVNTGTISANEDLLLHWEIPEKKEAPKKGRTWADAISKQEKKRARPA